MIIIGIATDRSDRRGAHELCKGAVTRQEIGDGAADLDDAFGELIAGEDVLEFGESERTLAAPRNEDRSDGCRSAQISPTEGSMALSAR